MSSRWMGGPDYSAPAGSGQAGGAPASAMPVRKTHMELPDSIQGSLNIIKAGLRQLERAGALRAAEYSFLVRSLEGFLQCWASGNHNTEESASAFIPFENREPNFDNADNQPSSAQNYPSTPRAQTYPGKHPVPPTPDTPKLQFETMAGHKNGSSAIKRETTSALEHNKDPNDPLNRFMEAAANGGIRVAPASGASMPMPAAYSWGHQPLPREKWIDSMAFYKGQGLKEPYKSIISNNPEDAWDKVKKAIAAKTPDLPRANDPAFHWPAGHFYGMENFEDLKKLGTSEFLGRLTSSNPGVRGHAEFEMMKAGWKGTDPVGMPMPPYTRDPKAPHGHFSVSGLRSNDATAPGHGVGARIASSIGSVNNTANRPGQAMGAPPAIGVPVQGTPYMPVGFDVAGFASMMQKQEGLAPSPTPGWPLSTVTQSPSHYDTYAQRQASNLYAEQIASVHNGRGNFNTRLMSSIHAQGKSSVPADVANLATPEKPAKIEPKPKMHAGHARVLRGVIPIDMATAAAWDTKATSTGTGNQGPGGHARVLRGVIPVDMATAAA
ncbi:hypothetical protein B0H67DRAFT_56808 [Lasiosphaeris hirsuta]|uniref:Uncharacterized protein n=1 Tax=Lasiosphaeris hirsuta TaxID=260670 RepID=A0AA40E8P1_9PEZI|nr:hypothetical protein B0H67DRAFT_56808 [Lasiosphaeris hirsuta]